MILAVPSAPGKSETEGKSDLLSGANCLDERSAALVAEPDEVVDDGEAHR